MTELVKNDIYLKPFEHKINERIARAEGRYKTLSGKGKFTEFANAHKYYGLHFENDNWVYRDRLPNATTVFLIGNFSNWQKQEKFRLKRTNNGDFEIKLPKETLKHEDLYRLKIQWNGGEGDRLPAYARRVVQDSNSYIFNAQVWQPKKQFKFKYKAPKRKKSILIYEAHVGMAAEEGKVATYIEFKDNILPRIAAAGYDTVQLMAIQEHPYYGSFGYHVANFFAASSRFGTPDELKQLVDEAHRLKIRVIMDIVHSHAVKNETEGLSHYDGTDYQFFHSGGRGQHPAWDSRCFDYGKEEVLHFLLSNCKFWLEEYNFDGFRFDGVTSMLYLHHGLGTDFSGYAQYFGNDQDEDAITYLMLANRIIHETKPEAVSIAEEMSGMPGLASPREYGGMGFDFRLAMGVPDFWVKLLKEVKDEHWHVGDIFHRLTDKRNDENVISYAESHDQALVGDKTIMFRLADKEIYYCMDTENMNPATNRATAMHKVIRLLTAACAGEGYLNFMGNEFGHPEWIDFPREGNGWSHHYARRQWSLADNPKLAFHYLNTFDQDMIALLKKHKVLAAGKPLAIVQNINDQVLIFKRANLIFVFNINPSQSFVDFGLQVPKGHYEIILNSDNKKYLGHRRIDETLTYSTVTSKPDKKHYLNLYIPNRMCMVLKKVRKVKKQNMLNIVLVEPKIPMNTGNIGRLSWAENCRLHLIKPLDFKLDDSRVKRAGQDYWKRVSTR